jgi:NodT family efflux transporter outer membrane factor (OMF) lipoprotein
MSARRTLGISGLLLAVAGCALGPDYVRPDAPAAASDKSSGAPGPTVVAEGEAQSFEQGKKVAADWWRLFQNPDVDAFIAEAVKQNPGLTAARSTLRQSQDLLQAGYGIFIPQVAGDVGANRQTTNLKAIGSPLPNTVFNLLTLSASVSYTLDVWGGERRQIEGLRALSEVQRFNTTGVYLMLIGNVVNTAIAEAAYRDQITSTQQLIGFESEQVAITRAQAEAGTVPFANVLTLQSQLAGAQASLPPLQQKIDQANHLLAALMGRSPDASPSPDGGKGTLALDDFKLPDKLPVSIPSELVRQRPDILMAEQQLISANAQIGVTTAAMFPSLTLSGGVGVSNGNLSNLFQPANLFWSLGASLVGPIVDGGTRWFQRKAAIDAHDAVLATYKQTVLGALEQVADALQALEHDAETLKAQADSVQAASEALKLTQANFQSGVATYLQVLIADEQYQQATLGFIQARAQRLQDTVALYVALGGGWWNAAEPIAG